MSLFRPSVFRQDPFFSPSFFPRSFASPFSLFDYPSITPPLYHVYQVEDSPSSPLRSKASPTRSEEKWAGDKAIASTSPSPSKDNRLAKKGNDQMDTRGSGSRAQSLFSPLPSLFSNAMGPLPSMDLTVDMFSTPTMYSIHAAVPGLDKKDIQLSVDNNILTIEAERREEKRFRKAPVTPSTTSMSTKGTGTQGQSIQGESTQGQSAPQGTSTSRTKESKEAEAKYPDADENAMNQDAMSDSGAQGDDGDQDVKYHHVESYYGRVSRRVQLPDDARVDELTAKYEDGMIKIDIPRTQEKQQRGRRIEIQ